MVFTTEKETAITTLRGFDLGRLLVLHTPPNFVHIIVRWYIRMLQPYMGVTSSAYGGFIPLKWAYILVFGIHVLGF